MFTEPSDAVMLILLNPTSRRLLALSLEMVLFKTSIPLGAEISIEPAVPPPANVSTNFESLNKLLPSEMVMRSPAFTRIFPAVPEF